MGVGSEQRPPYLTCLTSCLMLLDREKVLVWILLMATVLPSLEDETRSEHRQG